MGHYSQRVSVLQPERDTPRVREVLQSEGDSLLMTGCDNEIDNQRGQGNTD